MRRAQRRERCERRGTMATMPGGLLADIASLAVPTWGVLLVGVAAETAEQVIVGWQLGMHTLAAVAASSASLEPVFALACTALRLHTAAVVGRCCGGKGRGGTVVVGEALVVAAILGVAFCVLLRCLIREVVAWMITEEAFSMSIAQYLLIRALGIPAAFVGAAAQGAFRGSADAWTPLVVAALQHMLRIGVSVTMLWRRGGIALESHAAIMAGSEACGALLLVALATKRFDITPCSLRPRLSAVGGFLLAVGALYVCKVAQDWAVVGRAAAVSGLGPEAASAYSLVEHMARVVAVGAGGLEVAALTLVACRRGALPPKTIAIQLAAGGAALGGVMGAFMALGKWPLLSMLTQEGPIRAAAADLLPVAALMQAVIAASLVLDAALVGLQKYGLLVAVVGISAAAGRAALHSLPQTPLGALLVVGFTELLHCSLVLLYLRLAAAWERQASAGEAASKEE